MPCDYHICRHCGFRFSVHGGATNPFRPFACPKTGADPRYPHSLANRGGKHVAEADALYDRRIAAHWTARKTVFTGVS